MFKKVKFSDGRREFYIGKKKVFEYVRTTELARFLSKIYAKLSENDFSTSTQSQALVAKLCGGWGSFYDFLFLLNRAYVAPKYHKIFYDFYLRKERGERLVFVDGGCHNGVFADIALACGGLCHAFEPNAYLCAFLRNLYKNNAAFILHESAISTQDGETIFYDESDENAVGQGGSVVQWAFDGQRVGYKVRLMDFCEFVKSLAAQHGKINLVKIDIEGAEFEVLDALLERNLHENIEYLMVETHERFFADSAAKLATLKDKIAEKNAKNVYLDWV